MRGWRLPVAVSLVLHGALAVWVVLMPPPPPEEEADREPVRIEIVSVEAPPPPAPPVAEEPPPPPAPPVTPPKVKRAPSKTERAEDEDREAKPPDEAGETRDDREAGGVVADAEGGGPSVGSPGKTQDGRPLSSLDLGARGSVPAFEDQGPGVVAPEAKDPKRRHAKGGGFTYSDTAFGAHIARDGTVTFDDRGNSEVDGVPELGIDPGDENKTPSIVGTWTIDVNDLVMGALGDDPYSYEKRKFLEATREERLEMARAACGERLSESLADLPQQLSKIWAANRPAREKRAVLFDLWDDCAEDGGPEVLRYGELARLTILEFILRHMPRGSADAYTELEIDRLNARRISSRPFAPYGGRM